MIKYKITKYQEDDLSIVYTLTQYEEKVIGDVILVFEADSYNHASFIKNQFLNFEAYNPFEDCWLVKTSHTVLVDNITVEPMPHEIRTLLILARTADDARKKVEEEAVLYSQPYQNIHKKVVKWRFDKVLSVTKADFFSTIDLYKGIPVEIASKRTNLIPDIEEY